LAILLDLLSKHVQQVRHRVLVPDLASAGSVGHLGEAATLGDLFVLADYEDVFERLVCDGWEERYWLRTYPGFARSSNRLRSNAPGLGRKTRAAAFPLLQTSR
jgi:hypothetical protein